MAAMSYLQKHPKTGVYRIRRPIPVAARAAFGGRAVYLKSLGTKDLAEAKRAAFPILAEVQDRINRAIEGAVFWQTHDMQSYLVLFAEWSGWQIRRHDSRWVYDSRDEFQKDLAEFAQADLSGITPTDLNDFRLYVEDEEASLFPDQSRLEPEPEPARAAKRIKLSDLEARLIEAKDYEARSEMDARNVFGYLRELRGDCFADQIRHADIRELRECLLRYPVGGRTEAIVKMGLRKIAEKKWPRTMSPKTVKKLIGFVSSGFKLAVSEGWCDSNPCQGLLFPKLTPTSVKVELVDWRPEDLRVLFGSPLYLGSRNEINLATPGNVHVRDFHFWLPLLGMFTGARLTELCQLEPADIRQDEGVWYFHLTTRTDEDELHDEKSLKNPGSEREVPIHRALIDLKFLDFAKQRQGRMGLLFENHYPSPKVFSRKVSRWFGEYMDSIGLNDPALRFHSFRHSFKTACRMANIPAEVHDSLTGHVPQTVGGQYGKQMRLIAYLKEQIDRIQFDVDLSELATSNPK